VYRVKSLFEAKTAAEVKARLGQLRPDSERQWGKMNVAQAVAHCALGVETATGDLKPPRVMIGRLLGGIVKPMLVGDDKPMKRNSPTAKILVVADDRDLDTERQRLLQLIGRFVAAGPDGCTTHPHAFFGRLTPQEWSILMYKHLDHHLRQFGA
jgi:hypothetical protein